MSRCPIDRSVFCGSFFRGRQPNQDVLVMGFGAEMDQNRRFILGQV